MSHDGGIVQLEKFGIRLEVPPNALTSDQRQLISLTVITDLRQLTQHLEDGSEEDEVFAAFGIQCMPDGLKFNVPITVTIPHAIDLATIGDVTPVLYSSSGLDGMHALVNNYFVCSRFKIILYLPLFS